MSAEWWVAGALVLIAACVSLTCAFLVVTSWRVMHALDQIEAAMLLFGPQLMDTARSVLSGAAQSVNGWPAPPAPPDVVSPLAPHVFIPDAWQTRESSDTCLRCGSSEVAPFKAADFEPDTWVQCVGCGRARPATGT